MEENEVSHSCKKMNNIDLLGSWLIRCAIKDGKCIQKKNGDKKVIFGGRWIIGFCILF